MKKIQYLALDVDDQRFHGCLVSESESMPIEFRVPPEVGALVKKIETVRDREADLKICYEATYIGFCLQRKLAERGYCCDVIAPSLTPRKPGEHVKTDRLDSRKLAEYYQRGLLTLVHIPDESQEKVRGLIRSREFLVGQLKALRRHILANCRCAGLDYRRSDGREAKTSHWTGSHRQWLWRRVKEMTADGLKINLEALLSEMEHLEQRVNEYDSNIRRVAEQEDYQKAVKALCCYRGVDVLSAMTLVCELGDIRRFDHPKRLVAYAGMSIVETSSGGHERKFHISKTGNRFIRTTVIEACQSVGNRPHINRPLTKRRQGAEPLWIEIADRAMARLYRRATHLWHVNKPKNKIKVACARELLGFIWESLRAVASNA